MFEAPPAIDTDKLQYNMQSTGSSNQANDWKKSYSHFGPGPCFAGGPEATWLLFESVTCSAVFLLLEIGAHALNHGRAANQRPSGPTAEQLSIFKRAIQRYISMQYICYVFICRDSTTRVTTSNYNKQQQQKQLGNISHSSAKSWELGLGLVQ